MNDVRNGQDVDAKITIIKKHAEQMYAIVYKSNPYF